MHYIPEEMKYIKPVQDIVDTILSEAIGIEIVPTFPEEPKKSMSCIVHMLGTEKFGLIGINIEGIGDDVNCFIFNGKLYDYCRAEGFTQSQMVEDESFENKVLKRTSTDKFIEYFTEE